MQTNTEPPGMPQYFLAFVVSLLLWLLLAGTVSPDELLAGSVVSLLVTLVAGPRLAILNGLRLTPAAIAPLLRYLGHFAVALLRANLDLARRLLSPSLPLRPAVVEVETGLQSDLGRLLLANSITLTPGTLSIDVDGQRIRVHWIDAPPEGDLHLATEAIAAGFERHISGFLK